MQKNNLEFRKILYLTFFFTIVLSLPGFCQTKLFNISEIGSNSFKSILLPKKVIAIADLHGTKESPQIFLKLVKLIQEEKKELKVVLEINNNYQKNIDEYLKDGDLEKLRTIDFFRYPDGRTSIAMVELLREMREIDGISVICYDYDLTFGSGTQRDSLMAVNLSNNFSNRTMIILTGNMHSSLKEGCCGFPGFKSALYRFKQMKNLDNEVISLNTSAGGGTFWGCMADGCKEWEVAANKDIPEELKKSNFISLYKNEDQNGFNGMIYFSEVSPSFPVEQRKESK